MQNPEETEYENEDGTPTHDRADWKGAAREEVEALESAGIEVAVDRGQFAKPGEPFKVSVGGREAVQCHGWPAVVAFLKAHAQHVPIA